MRTESTPAPAEIADCAEAAADYIDTHGWCQASFQDDEGRVCMYGSLSRGVKPRSSLLYAVDAAITARIRATSDRDHILSFNDTLGRTQGEVTDIFRHTAKALRNGEILP